MLNKGSRRVMVAYSGVNPTLASGIYQNPPKCDQGSDALRGETLSLSFSRHSSARRIPNGRTEKGETLPCSFGVSSPLIWRKVRYGRDNGVPALPYKELV